MTIAYITYIHRSFNDTDHNDCVQAKLYREIYAASHEHSSKSKDGPVSCVAEPPKLFMKASTDGVSIELVGE